MNDKDVQKLIEAMKPVFATKDDLKEIRTDIKEIRIDIEDIRADIKAIHTDIIAHDEKFDQFATQLNGLPSREEMDAHRTEHAIIKRVLREELNAEV